MRQTDGQPGVKDRRPPDGATRPDRGQPGTKSQPFAPATTWRPAPLDAPIASPRLAFHSFTPGANTVEPHCSVHTRPDTAHHPPCVLHEHGGSRSAAGSKREPDKPRDARQAVRRASHTRSWTLFHSSARRRLPVGRRRCLSLLSDAPATLPVDEAKVHSTVRRQLVIHPRAQRGYLEAAGMEEVVKLSRRLACSDESRRALTAVRVGESRRRRSAVAVMLHVGHHPRKCSHGNPTPLRHIVPGRRGGGRPAGQRRVRSATRRGDSGDGPGEPEPGEARRLTLGSATGLHRRNSPNPWGRHSALCAGLASLTERERAE